MQFHLNAPLIASCLINVQCIESNCDRSYPFTKRILKLERLSNIMTKKLCVQIFLSLKIVVNVYEVRAENFRISQNAVNRHGAGKSGPGCLCAYSVESNFFYLEPLRYRHFPCIKAYSSGDLF